MGLNNEYADRVVIDIETIASPQCAELLDPVRPPANYKDAAKIAAYCEEKLVERIATAGLEADLCEVVAIGYAVNGRDSLVQSRRYQDEAEMLEWLWKAIGKRATIGFNSLSFDLPVLIRRSQLLDVVYPDLSLDRYRSPHVDLLEWLTFRGAITKRSLAFYCRRFGIPCADPVKGAEIPELVAANDWLAVETHCQSDVDKTAALARRLGLLKGEPVAA